MNKNYVFKNSKSLVQGLPAFMKCYSKICCLIVALFSVASLNAQTTIINPATDGGFNLGSTFAANGWTVANEGTSSVKWAVGTAASGTTSVGTTIGASASVTLTAANPSINVGQIVYGSGIPVNTFVSAIAGTALTLSQPATISAAGVALGFGNSSGGISVGTTQVTNASAITAGSYTLTLLAANPNISVGMLITPNAFIGANTYVASINGTALGLSNPTIAAAAASQNLTFSATTAAITGNAAYVSNDNGVSNSYAGYPTNRTVYFYKDITTIPSSEKAMTLTFDVKSAPASSAGWQVWVAPISQNVVGTDTQVTTAFTYGVNWPGATLISFNSNPQVATTKTTAFIPKSFAGTSFRLIFVWTNNTAAGSLPPAAIDNISLTSRVPEEITSAQSGLWSQPSTWDGGKVPTHADTVVLDNDSESVMIDSRYSGCEDLILLETNTLVQFANSSVVDEFTVYNDVNIAASGARFNNHDGANGKYLKVGHNFDVAAGARFDSQIGFGGFASRLNLNGSTLQTVTVDPAGFVGGSAIALNTSSNVVNVLGTLEVTNTSTASPNVIWNADNIRIKSALLLPSGRVSIASGKRLILGNFSALGNITCPTGYGITSGTLSKWVNAANTRTVNSGTEYPGSDVSFKTTWYPFISAANQDRSLYLLPDANPSVSGEVAINYSDATTLTGSLSIADGSYTINNRYNGNWAFSTPDSSVIAPSITYTSSTNHRVGLYANGAYNSTNGTSRLMYASSAIGGTHQEGTSTPFVFRTGLSLTDLTTAPIYIGFDNASFVNTATAITSATSGDWNSASTWVGGVVPTCTDNVIIASGNTVTVTTTANAAGVVVQSGGTLVNNSATIMTVGCTNNNAAFYNYGTYTMTSGTLKVNGFMSHKLNSTFNQTGGDIVIDSNDNGNAATSVAFGGTSCKIETSNLGLTGGKITIVDPLVNISTPITGTSISNYTLDTEGATGTFTHPISAAYSTGTTVSINVSAESDQIFFAGQTVTGGTLQPGTTVASVAGNFGFTRTITLSLAPTGAMTSGTLLTYSSMQNGLTRVVMANNVNNANIAVGQGVSGPGIQAGTVVTATMQGIGGGAKRSITLSLPISGLATSPITSPQTLSFAAVNPGAYSTVLTAANPSITVGMSVTGTGIKPGTIVTNISGAAITLSEPIQPGAPSPLVMDFTSFNTQFSGSFIYASPTHYAAGLNHTLQIGDGVSTQNTSSISTGFNCQFMAAGGLLSLGNLTVDAPDGANRFMNVSNNNINNNFYMNVQNAFTVTAGSVFKKNFGNGTVYVGGNIINNGTINMPWQGTGFYLGNNINGQNASTNLPQTISGSGVWETNQWALSNGPASGYALWSLNINNTNPAGVTLQVPNFRCSSGVTFINGILHTSAAYPIYSGIFDVTSPLFGGTFGGGNTTSYVDGPCVHANKSDANIAQYRLFPTGKNGKYLPIYISSTGGVELMVEAFDSNAGTVNGTNASNLSANRWNVSRVGSAGAFTGYNVRIGSNPDVLATNLIVHSATENGVYDIVSTPASPAMTFATSTTSTQTTLGFVATTYTPNTITLTTAQTGGFLGNFAYADGPSCSGTPAPVAAASSTTLCLGQSTTLSLTGLTGAGLTYQWQMDSGSGFENIALATNATYVANPTTNASYQCVVTCSSVSGTSNAVAITVSQSTAVTTGATICAAGVANLSATGGSILNWYDAATGGSLLTTGATYAPTVSSTTTYYVSSASTSAGSVNTAAWVGTASSSALFKGIAFDVTNKTKLNTVTVYPKNTAALTPITISLYDATGNIVSGTTPVTFTPTLNTGTIGAVSQVVTLNYNIPIGNGYRLVASNGLVATTNTLGNSAAAITYPTGGAIRLLGNVSALNDAVATGGATTNCFHNLTFDETCESVTRTPVTATVGCNSIVDLKLFIEGYMDGSTMRSVDNNQGGTGASTDVVTVTVKLHDASLAEIATTTGMLQTDGTLQAVFTTAPTGSFYISVSGTNFVRTWSSTMQTVGTTPLNYDFSNVATKAAGSNMKSVGGIYTFFSGDLDADGFLDFPDYGVWETDFNNGAVGVYSSDLDGDGFVDFPDYGIWEANFNAGVTEIQP